MSLRPVMAGMLTIGIGCVVCANEDKARTEAARAAIERSLPFLEAKGVTWMQERSCVTCHHTPMMIWTHSEARRRGFDVDSVQLDGWRTWAFLQMLATLDAGINDESDTLSQLLLGRDAASPWFDKPPKWHSRNTDPFENLTKYLLKSQAPDGAWSAGGQSSNPQEIPTAWALVALASRDAFMNTRFPKREDSDAIKNLVQTNDQAIPVAREAALAWLLRQDPKRTNHLTEAVVSRYLVCRLLGKPEVTAELVAVLLGRQNMDGGWSADIDLHQPSDAFATGQSIYALAADGDNEPRVKTSIRRAARFLTQSQSADGSWHVPTTAFHPSKGDLERDTVTDEVYTYWGTAWATLGLLQTLPL